MIKVVIEMPEGDDRRRHFNKKKTRLLDLGLLINKIPVNGGIMPVNYGFIKDTWNKADKDELDVLVLSKDKMKPGKEIEVEPIALIIRADNDHKVVAVDQTAINIKGWEDIPAEKRQVIEAFFSFHAQILSIEDGEEAKNLIENSHK